MLHLLFDVLGIIGLLMLGYGLYLISPVHMYLGLGSIFLLFALLAARGTVKIKSPNKQG